MNKKTHFRLNLQPERQSKHILGMALSALCSIRCQKRSHLKTNRLLVKQHKLSSLPKEGSGFLHRSPLTVNQIILNSPSCWGVSDRHW